MSMILIKVTDFLKQNKKIMYYLGIFALIYFAMGDSVFAEGEDESGTVSSTIIAVNYAFKFISILIGIITNFVGLFLNPSWTNGTVLGLQVHLKELWILISNIVYFIFAILLIAIAFMNIVGRGEKWELKQALPRFVIGVLIVPFSWFFIQVVISFSSILTATVLSLPYDTLKNSDIKFEEIKICKHLYVNGGGGDEGAVNTMTQKCVDYETAESMLTGDNVFAMLNIYTYGIFAIDTTTSLFNGDATTTKTMADLSFKVIFNLLIVLVFGILVISLGLALFVRGMWLWLYMIFSPVFGLLYFFSKEKDGIMDGKFSITQFISLALVPVYVAGALSFGLLFIFVAGQGLGKDVASGGANVIFSVEKTPAGTGLANSEGEHTGKGTVVVTLLNTYKIEMGGSLANSADTASTISKELNGFKGALGTIIMQLFGLAVLWISVISALSANKITEGVIKPIAEFGNQVGGLISKSPQYLPIFGGQSMQSLKTAGGSVSSSLQTIQNTKGNKFAEKNFGGIMGGDKEAEYRGIGATTPGQDIDKAYTNIANLNKVGSTQDIANSKSARDAYVMNLNKINTLKGFRDKTEADKFIKMIENSNASKADIDEALSGLDRLAMSSRKSILGGTTDVARGNVDDYLGTKASGYTATADEIFIAKPVGGRNGDNQTYSILNTNIDVNVKEKKILNEDSTYEKMALSLQRQGVIGSINKQDLDNEFKTNIGIDNPDDIYKGIVKFLKKGEDGVIIFDGEGNGDLIPEDLFPDAKK